MQYRLLGRTGLYVSPICLGTMTYGGKGFWEVIGQLQIDAVKDQLAAARDAGVNFIDTANIYHEGLSEALVGQALKELAWPRHELVLATKVRGRMGAGPNDLGLTRKHIFDQIDASLRRLGTDYVDLYQIHGVDPVTPIEETMRALDDVVRAGKVRYLGVSNHAAWQIMKALGISERERYDRFRSIQAYYSIAGRDLEREIVPLAQSEGLGILAWSPLAGGLLSGKFERDAEGPAGTRRAAFDFPPVDRPRAFDCVDAMRPIAAAHGCSVARVALAWTLQQPAITSIIIGARTRAQLDDNLAAADLTLTPDELATLDAVSGLPAEYPGWMIQRQTSDRG
ncbi:MAG: aldo/keto reductase [Myxococcales bacterium]|nr:aldo/keto reductase [Myxococcales bacterium]